MKSSFRTWVLKYNLIRLPETLLDWLLHNTGFNCKWIAYIFELFSCCTCLPFRHNWSSFIAIWRQILYFCLGLLWICTFSRPLFHYSRHCACGSVYFQAIFFIYHITWFSRSIRQWWLYANIVLIIFSLKVLGSLVHLLPCCEARIGYIIKN